MNLTGILKWKDDNATLRLGDFFTDIFTATSISGSFSTVLSSKNIVTTIVNNNVIANVTLGNQTWTCESCIHGDCIANETCVCNLAGKIY